MDLSKKIRLVNKLANTMPKRDFLRKKNSTFQSIFKKVYGNEQVHYSVSVSNYCNLYFSKKPYKDYMDLVTDKRKSVYYDIFRIEIQGEFITIPVPLSLKILEEEHISRPDFFNEVTFYHTTIKDGEKFLFHHLLLERNMGDPLLYNELSPQEKRNYLMGEVSKNKGLTFEQIETICSNKEVISLQEPPEIIVTKDSTEFAKLITLQDVSFSHSWAGDYSTKEEGYVIFAPSSPFEFGYDYSDEYSLNGDITRDNSFEESPCFNENKSHCVLIKKHEWDCYNRIEVIDEDTYTLVIFIPH